MISVLLVQADSQREMEFHGDNISWANVNKEVSAVNDEDPDNWRLQWQEWLTNDCVVYGCVDSLRPSTDWAILIVFNKEV